MHVQVYDRRQSAWTVIRMQNATERTRQRKDGLLDFLPYLLALIPFVYGLKCIVTQHGTLFFRSQRNVPIDGLAAVMEGWGFVALAVFLVLSDGRPPTGRSWRWRIARWLLRWGTFLALIW